MEKTTGIILAVGLVAVAGYFLVNATSSTATECNGDWTDYFNPVCWVSSASAYASNEINTILIILGVVVVLVIALIAFGPQSSRAIAATGALL